MHEFRLGHGTEGQQLISMTDTEKKSHREKSHRHSSPPELLGSEVRSLGLGG